MKTLLNLTTEASQLTDYDDSDFITSTEWKNYANNSLGDLYDQLIQGYGSSYFLTTTPQEISIISGTDVYDLESTFYKCGGVDVVIGGYTYSIQPMNFAERNRYQNNAIVTAYPSSIRKLRYRIMGTKIKFAPIPDASFTAKIWYVPKLTKLSDDTDEVDTLIEDNWMRFITLDMAIQARIKGEESTSALINERSRIEDKIEAIAQDRLYGQPHYGADVDMLPINDWY